LSQEKLVIVSTHILEEVSAVCTRAMIIARGKMLVNETPTALMARSTTGKLDDVFRQLTGGM